MAAIQVLHSLLSRHGQDVAAYSNTYLPALVMLNCLCRTCLPARYNLHSVDLVDVHAIPACLQQVDCLGDPNSQVKEAAAAVLTAAMQQWDLPSSLQKLSLAWTHHSYHVKQGAMACATAVIASKPVAISLPDQWQTLVLKPAAQLLDDPHRCFALAPGPCCAMSCPALPCHFLVELHCILG